uniref:Uncharacterized protein n=1 Tax=Rhizophora mucronata TaxID=61149 RepID=A0A2P2PHK2_RHIMU
MPHFLLQIPTTNLHPANNRGDKATIPHYFQGIGVDPR